MTSDEARALADGWLSALREEPCAAFAWSACEARTHWRFFWNTVAAMESRAPALKGVDPVCIDKRTGAVLFDSKPSDRTAPKNVAYPSAPSGPVATQEEAARIAQAWLDATMEHWCSITSGHALPYGWAFQWTTDDYIRTGDIMHALAGNGPLVVLKDSGELYGLGSAKTLEAECVDFEREVLNRRPAR